MSRKGADAIVVGGGLVGCMVARSLAADGLEVTIVERAKIGREASYDAAGMLSPQAETAEAGLFLDLCLEARELYPTLADELFAEVGSDVWYRDEGTLLLALDEREAAQLKTLAALQQRIGLHADVITGDDARQLEPVLSPNICLAIDVPGDHQVDNRRLVEAAALSCYARKVRIIENTPVRSISRDVKGRVRGVDTTAGRLEADLVIIAAGCWSNFIEEFPVPVEPVKGQILMLELASPPCRRVLRSERCYVVARIDGRVLIGATVERAGFDKTVAPSAVGMLLESARELAPSLGSAFGGEAWAGLRPATPDGVPAIGFVEEGLMAAVGHFRNGILLAPITGRIVANIVAGREPHPAQSILDPLRFAARATAP